MDINWLSLIVGVNVIALLVWVPMEIIHKAGYSRWWFLLILLTGPIAVVVFAFAEWPIHRELGWLRLVAGERSAQDIAMAQDHAIELERKGEWQSAIEVYELLARKSPDKQEAEFATNSILRLRAMLDPSGAIAP